MADDVDVHGGGGLDPDPLGGFNTGPSPDGARAFAPVDWVVLEGVLHGGAEYAYRVYESARTVAVLGRSCAEEDDLEVLNCRADGVPIQRRAGGGGTVVLAKGMAVITAAGVTSLPFHLKEHMNAVNESVIALLKGLGVRDLAIRGVSDIALGDRKIAGSSLYRTRNIVLYQGSLLVDPDPGVFDRYLKHPKKEPEYRRGRPHAGFLTSLRGEGYAIGTDSIVAALSRALAEGPPWRGLRAPV